jgi:hypothetical protein
MKDLSFIISNLEFHDLFITIGKQYDGYSPRPREHETFNMEEPTNLLQDPESLILAMERVTVLFDRLDHVPL